MTDSELVSMDAAGSAKVLQWLVQA